MTWGMRWGGTVGYVYYALAGATLVAAVLWWRGPDWLLRTERRMGHAQHGPAAIRRNPCRCKGCDPLVPMTRPLTSGEREAFKAIKDNYTNAQQGETT